MTSLLSTLDAFLSFVVNLKYAMMQHQNWSATAEFITPTPKYKMFHEGQKLVCMHDFVCVHLVTRQKCPPHDWRAGGNPAVQIKGRGPAHLRWSVCHSELSESPQPSHPTKTKEK